MTATKEKWAFPGLRYFDDDPIDRQLFFGRANEIKELTEKILAENLTIFFGRSGDGKTSLINAGLKQSLRDLGYLAVRVRIFNTPETVSPIPALYKAVEAEALRHDVSLPADWQKPTLWETFYYLRPTATNGLKPIVLILDQFEELFTIMAAKKDKQEEFIQQFADLVRGRLPDTMREELRAQLATLEVGSEKALEIEKLLFSSAAPGVRVLLSLREDYLAFLDNLGERIPTVYHSRYRLSSLSPTTAEEAIANPPQQKEVLGERAFQIAPDAVQAMLKFLTAESSRAGRSEQEVVGPPQLQMLCRELEKRMRRKHRDHIGLNDLGGEKGMSHLLSRYYRDIRKKFPLLRLGRGPKRRQQGLLRYLSFLAPVHFPRLAVRRLCEDRLITAGGNRNSRHEEEIIDEIGVSQQDLDTLVESRLLRREPRSKEVFYYELSHDSLVPSLLLAGNIRRTWTMGVKIVTIALLIFLGWQWGLPYIRDRFAVDILKRDLASVKKGEHSIEVFRSQLYRVKKFASDSLVVAKVENEFDRWRMADLEEKFLNWNVPYLNRADSILAVFKREYPSAPRISALDDTLRQRKLQEVERKYHRIVQADGMLTTARLDSAATFLDSAFLTFDRDPRITLLQADLEGRRGDLKKQQELLKEVERNREIVRRQLLAAIKLQSPQNMVVSGKTRRLELRLEPERMLQGALLRLNGREMKERRGFLEIPPSAKQVTAQIQVTDKNGVEASKTFTFAIDRTPPSLRRFQISYRESNNVNWTSMPDRNWRGTFWRIEGQASELIQSCRAQLVLTKTLQQSFAGTLTEKKDTFIIEGTKEAFKYQAKLIWQIEIKDLAGWQKTIHLGEWMQSLPPHPSRVRLRSPRALSELDTYYILREYDFFDSNLNPEGRGFANRFEEKTIRKDRVVNDRASGLIWQQGGSEEGMNFEETNAYIQRLNNNQFGGHTNWRLPTLEEAMSLMKPSPIKGELHIDPQFDHKQFLIWTSDSDESARMIWSVNFKNGGCYRYYVLNNLLVRAVCQM